MGKQVVEDLCGEDGLAFELGLEIEASDEAASALLTRAVEGDLRGVPLQEAAHPASDLVLGADTPAFGDEGKGSEVDEVLDGADLGAAECCEKPPEISGSESGCVAQRLRTPDPLLKHLATHLSAHSQNLSVELREERHHLFIG